VRKMKSVEIVLSRCWSPGTALLWRVDATHIPYPSWHVVRRPVAPGPCDFTLGDRQAMKPHSGDEFNAWISEVRARQIPLRERRGGATSVAPAGGRSPSCGLPGIFLVPAAGSASFLSPVLKSGCS